MSTEKKLLKESLSACSCDRVDLHRRTHRREPYHAGARPNGPPPCEVRATPRRPHPCPPCTPTYAHCPPIVHRRAAEGSQDVCGGLTPTWAAELTLRPLGGSQQSRRKAPDSGHRCVLDESSDTAEIGAVIQAKRAAQDTINTHQLAWERILHALVYTVYEWERAVMCISVRYQAASLQGSPCRIVQRSRA